MNENSTTTETIENPGPSRTDHDIWTAVCCSDARAERRWLAALGFEEGIVVIGGDGPDSIRHSEMLWPEGGRVMVHSARPGDEFDAPLGSGRVYVVCDDPDAVFAKANALDARVVRPMKEEDYGSRGFSIADPEGNIWSFGTYAG